MKLISLKYSEFENVPMREWYLESCDFENFNLIVGENATGKTRLVRIIRSLANMLSKNTVNKISDLNIIAEFIGSDNLNYIYELKIRDTNIEFEKLTKSKTILLTRNSSGEGSIFTEQIQGDLNFQIDPKKIAVCWKRDKKLHPFLEELIEWGESTFAYFFGEKLGQDHLLSDPETYKNTLVEPDLKDNNSVIAVFSKGINSYPDFEKTIVQQMNHLQFDIDHIEIGHPATFNIIPQNLEAYALLVSDKNKTYKTEHMNLSQGMFRCLATLIYVNYLIFSERSGLIVIDDIGEGLDFKRSSKLICLLIERCKQNSKIQLVLTSNDKFVMNKVPMEHWIVLVREKNVVKNLNYKNSKKIFQDFEFTGLSNFDFFSSAYYRRKPKFTD